MIIVCDVFSLQKYNIQKEKNKIELHIKRVSWRPLTATSPHE